MSRGTRVEAADRFSPLDSETASETESSRVVEHWDHEYAGREVEVPDASDPVLAAALSHFGDVRGQRLLDLGCGTGAATLFFAQRGARVVAMDISGHAVRKLRDYCSEHGIENVEAVQGDAFDIARLGRFDLARQEPHCGGGGSQRCSA